MEGKWKENPDKAFRKISSSLKLLQKMKSAFWTQNFIAFPGTWESIFGITFQTRNVFGNEVNVYLPLVPQ